MPTGSAPFADFSAAADAIGATTSKLAKRDLLAAYLRELPAADVAVAATFFAGRPLPGAADKLGLGWVQLSEALGRASGAGERELSQAYLRHSDVGDAAVELLEQRDGEAPSTAPLAMADVDGLRAQLHLGPGTGGPRLFSRDLNEVSISFPEVVAAASRLDGAVVLDGELVPYREGSVLDFASLQTRLGRVNPSTELVASVPVVLITFDLLRHDGRDALDLPLRERRKLLEELALPDRTDGGLLYSHLATARGAAEVDAFFDDARDRHNEGLMVKDPESSYQPGRRGLGWLKLKRALATLDCVVVGVEWGHGKRRGVLSDYTFAVLAPDGESLLTIGKAYTGLTDAEIAEMTEYFLANTVH